MARAEFPLSKQEVKQIFHKFRVGDTGGEFVPHHNGFIFGLPESVDQDRWSFPRGSISSRASHVLFCERLRRRGTPCVNYMSRTQRRRDMEPTTIEREVSVGSRGTLDFSWPYCTCSHLLNNMLLSRRHVPVTWNDTPTWGVPVKMEGTRRAVSPLE